VQGEGRGVQLVGKIPSQRWCVVCPEESGLFPVGRQDSRPHPLRPALLAYDRKRPATRRPLPRGANWGARSLSGRPDLS